MTVPDQATTTIENLFAPLELAVFERLPTGLFQPAGRMPVWLPVGPEPVDLSDLYPLLELFLADCEQHWQGHSDVWTEPGPNENELYLQAVAITQDDRRFIVLRSLPQALFTYQQLAHDFELAKEKVERLSHDLELKKQEAERATQAKSDFLATMSHEIRTPLNAIIGMADVLSATALTPEQQKPVEVFKRNGLSLLNLINDILDLSKVESGRVELESTALDLREVIARAMEVVEAKAAAKALWLRQTIDPGVALHRLGDPNRLRQIIINLLGNSIKFTDRGGLEVRVTPEPDDSTGERLRFEVKDTGIGIPADKLDLIFESFTQADSSTTRKYGGTGLGLAISKQLVELMDGRIRVESQPGVGSTFIFTARLPVSTAPAAASEPAARASLSPGLRILLADDSEDNRYLILSYLNRAEAVVEIADNGAIAVAMFRRGYYDAVLMDVEMPVMDGYAATREIRRIELETAAPPTPILALTAHAFADMAAKGLEAGFTAVLTKPIRKATLLGALAGYSASHHASEPAQISVRVEQGMEDVVPGYLEKRRADVTIYRAALAANDLDAIRKLAHKMKGTGAGYGFPVLTELGGAIEKAALEANAGVIHASLDELERFLKNVNVVYIN
jgi:signal transduction histidine kinase/DNA-binding NarL/FixJ family response regulator